MMQWNEGERRFQQLADSAPTLMWRSDETMACDWVNRAWLEFTGRSLEQELGFGWADGLHPDDRDACVEAYSDAFARSEPFSLSYRLRRADGVFRWILDNARPFTDEDGRLAGYFGSCTDVDDMVKANEALSLAVRERAEAIAQRDHLLREVQHRVRNNLQLILSIVDMQIRAVPESRPALMEVAGRVRSIAKAQALLLDPTGKAEIDLAQYVSSLVQGTPVRIDAPDAPMMTPLTRAVPLGLMINEILSAMSRDDEDAQRILISRADGGARIEIEARSGTASSHSAISQSRLVQRLGAQAGARVSMLQGQPSKIVLQVDSLP